MALGSVLLLMACGDPERRAHSPSRRAAPLSGMVLERIDAPPYSYLRLETSAGEAWVAIPVAPVPLRTNLTIANGVALRGYAATQLGRRFDLITFGTIEARR